MDHKMFTVFQYDRNHFVFNINPNETCDSEFDLVIKEKWQNALKDNIFRYKLDIQEWKLLNGQYNYLAQLNTNRAENRRKPEEISSMFQPFDPNRFNFNKISDKEILLDTECGDGNNVIAINVSPIEQYHCLFLPQRLENLPQIMTKNSLQKVLELMMMSNSIDFRAAFNSLGAFASVNHLHWHFYYLQHRMPLENIALTNVNNSPVHLLVDFPAKGFCINLSSIKNKLINNLANWVFLIVDYLQNNNIAHNVYITRANRKCSKKLIFDDIRVYIWARKHSYGIKNTKAFFSAVCELFGHLSIRNREEYDSLTEERVAEIIRDVTEETFYSAKEKVVEIVQKKLLFDKNVSDT